MYRFAFTPRWLGGALLALGLAAVMVMLGNWQLNRYHERAAVNDRIDAADTADPVPLERALPAPAGAAGTAGPAPSAAVQWIRASSTGRYDREHQILVRGRTVEGRVGFEVVTPLVLDSGAAVLVNRGWLPAPTGDATALPSVPEPPTGSVTVTGRVHLSESRPGQVQRRGGFIDVRRISVPQLAKELPYPLLGAYLLVDPPDGSPLRAIPVGHENAWQNAAYVVQWWLLAGLALIGFGWLVRREARTRSGDAPTPARSAPVDASG